MGYTPFKMKGSPMQRNFGIGESPAKDRDYGELASQAESEGASEETVEKLKKRASTQKSAQEYVKKNPDAKRVDPYASGEKIVGKKKSEDESA